MGIGLPVAKFLDISPSPPAPLPGGEGREPANPLPSQREMALPTCRGRHPACPEDRVVSRDGSSEPEWGKFGSVGAQGGQLPAATRPPHQFDLPWNGAVA